MAERSCAPGRTGRARRHLALVSEVGDSVDLLEAAVTELEQGNPIERARALLDLGAAFRRTRRRRDAREVLREGLEIARRHGAAALADRAAFELEATGARLRTQPLSGAESLTARERQVADLAASGRSNPEIAQALFVTRKTVESHLRTVFRKLDVTSREDVADALRSPV